MRRDLTWRALLATLLVGWLLSVALPASAHTELESTTPADSAVLGEDVDVVVLTYTRPVSLIGDGISLSGPSGSVEAEVAGSQEDAVWTATAAEPLGPGDYQVEWTVAAQDGHPLSGEFAFTVKPGDGAASASTDPGDGAAAAAERGSGSAEGGSAGSGVDSGARDDFELETVEARSGAGVALTGLLVAAGGLAFLAMVLRGGEDTRAVLRIVRWAGVAVVAGVTVRLLARSAVITQGDWAAALSRDGIADALIGSTFWVFALQLGGGLLIALGAWGGVLTSAAAWVGTLLAGAGHVLGGHSSTAEPRWLVLVADVSHLVAGAVWLGGVVFVSLVLGRRRRKGRDLDAAILGARFSVIAGASVAIVGAAGVALTVTILEQPSQLWASTWGLLLLAKVAVVVVVAGYGAHHHLNVVPHLASGDAERADAAAHELRRSTVVEAWLLLGVGMLTAWLVAASTFA